MKQTTPISPREREIWLLLAKGMRGPEIAKRLGLSYHTVRDYRKSLYHKVGIHKSTEVAGYCEQLALSKRVKHLTDEDRLLRMRARRLYRLALQIGFLVRKPCEKCGVAADGHHPDYRKPLHVRWLCPEHHVEAHMLGR